MIAHPQCRGRDCKADAISRQKFGKEIKKAEHFKLIREQRSLESYDVNMGEDFEMRKQRKKM